VRDCASSAGVSTMSLPPVRPPSSDPRPPGRRNSLRDLGKDDDVEESGEPSVSSDKLMILSAVDAREATLQAIRAVLLRWPLSKDMSSDGAPKAQVSSETIHSLVGKRLGSVRAAGENGVNSGVGWGCTQNVGSWLTDCRRPVTS